MRALWQWFLLSSWGTLHGEASCMRTVYIGILARVCIHPLYISHLHWLRMVCRQPVRRHALISCSSCMLLPL